MESILTETTAVLIVWAIRELSGAYLIEKKIKKLVDNNIQEIEELKKTLKNDK